MNPGTEKHPAPARRANLRLALILLSVVLVFFFGIMLKYWLQNHG